MNSLMTYIPNALSNPISRQILKTQKASPTILFVGGIVGVVATSVAASRSTLKLKETLSEHKENIAHAKKFRDDPEYDYSENDYQRDMTILYARIAVDTVKLYSPALLLGAASICALAGSHNILTKRNAALTAAYAALDKGFNEYRRRVVDELGPEADRRFRFSTDLAPVTDKTPVKEDGTPVKQYKVDPNAYSIYARFFDELCKNYSRDPGYNFVFLRAQQNYANDLLKSRGHIFLNEVYDMLGLERSRAGSVVGWVVGKTGDNYVDFGIFSAEKDRARDFVNGREDAILLDFNVDGVIYDKI